MGGIPSWVRAGMVAPFVDCGERLRSIVARHRHSLLTASTGGKTVGNRKQPYRPASPKLTTQINVDGDKYLHDDFAFGTRDELIHRASIQRLFLIFR